MGSNFPTFSDGDVEIVVCGSRPYRLHSTVLQNASVTFRALLDQDHAAKLSDSALRRGVTIRFRLILKKQISTGAGCDKIAFDHCELSEEGVPIGRARISLDLRTDRTPDPIHIAFHQVLGALYSIPIDLGELNERDFTRTLNAAQNIADVARCLKCEHLINTPLESSVLALDQTLYRAISAAPILWLRLGSFIRSQSIFKEALVLAAGMYNTASIQEAMNALDDGLKSLLTRKAAELRGRVRAAFQTCHDYYPATLPRVPMTGVPGRNIGREAYQKDIFHWMALCAARQWMMTQVNDDTTHNAEDMGFSMVKTIITDDRGWLDRTYMDHFHQSFQITESGRPKVADSVGVVKTAYKALLAPLWISERSLDMTKHRHTYFTSVPVDLADYPWQNLAPQAQQPATGTSEDLDGGGDKGEEGDSGDGLDTETESM